MSSPDRTMNRIESGILTVRELRDYSKIPVSGLLEKLNISQYSALTPFIDSVEQQPYEVKILMKQHTGAPCTPLVSTSDRVKKGEIIGHITDGSTGACIHASISGTVTAATADFVKIKFN
jgi:Na+-translocating ferredoxin:NAD+ oxidoreductase RnfC subunit